MKTGATQVDSRFARFYCGCFIVATILFIILMLLAYVGISTGDIQLGVIPVGLVHALVVK